MDGTVRVRNLQGSVPLSFIISYKNQAWRSEPDKREERHGRNWPHGTCAAWTLVSLSHVVNGNCYFLGAFAKLRKTSISFLMPFRPSVRMEQLGSYW